MTPRRAGRFALVAVALVALVAAVAGCGGSTGASGAATSTVVGGSATPVSTAALATVVATRTKALLHTARAFHRCDHAEWDSSGPAPCLARARAETAAAAAFLGDLRALGSPPSYSITIKDLAAMKRAGAKIAVRCAHGDDQVCDQALARFRADEQSVLWDLDATL